MRILINKGYGLFGLSDEAMLWLVDHGCPLGTWDDVEAGKTIAIVKLDEEEVLYEKYTFLDDYLDEGKGLDYHRTHPLLLQCFDELGPERFSSNSRSVKAVEIPDGVDWELCEADSGIEWIAEKHRTWS